MFEMKEEKTSTCKKLLIYFGIGTDNALPETGQSR